MADTVRVGLDRFVLDALGSEALEERVEPGDGEGDPARARVCRVRFDEEPGALVDLPEDLFPDATVRGSPEERVYQSTLASRSDTGTPAERWVIELISSASISSDVITVSIRDRCRVRESSALVPLPHTGRLLETSAARVAADGCPLAHPRTRPALALMGWRGSVILRVVGVRRRRLR